MPFLRAALIEKKARPESEALPDVEPVVEAYVEPVIEESVEAEDDTPKDSEYVDGLASLEDVSPDGVPEDSPDVPDVQKVQEEPQAEPEQETDETEEEPDGLPEEILEAVTEDTPEPTPEQDTNEEAGEADEADGEPDGLPEEILEAVAEDSPELEQEPTSHKDYSGDTLNYDFTSGERYVDTVSTKTEFDKMLDELAAISKDLLSHEVEKFAVKFTGKFQGDNDKAEADAKKYTAFLGGYITNAAMTLYDNGYRDAAIKQLDQAKSILEARMKLEEETEAIKTRVEDDNDAVDLTDILGLFGD